MRLIPHIGSSLLLTVVLLFLWMWLASLFVWRQFTAWGMAHGGFVVALPACFVAANVVVFLGARAMPKRWGAALRRDARHW